MKTLLILTGWTRGLGEGILRGYADIHGKDLSVIGIARSNNEELAAFIRSRIHSLHAITADLADAGETDVAIRELEACHGKIREDFGKPEKSILVNNAAILGHLGTLPAVKDRQAFHRDAAAAFSLNCITPALLSGWFLSQASRDGQGCIINISSGASQGPMSGAGIYSMTKAALNILSKSLASEQPGGSEQIKVIAFSPGMVETSMQETIREQSQEQFPPVEYFREAARNGTTRSHIETGKFIASLDYDSLENGSYHHIQEWA